ncbi:MAG: hypothetical protein ILA02_06375 [Clostridia bacterium]|nr:hypothetical protein [Clostridia bacterium]
MRKILFILALIILLIFTGVVIYKGTNFGRFKVWGITQIIEKNDEIDSENAQLSSLVSVTYPSTLTKLSNSSEKLQQTKKEYEEQSVMLSDSNYYMQTEKYKLDFLWTRIGNHAKDNKVEIKIDVTNGTANGIYNLNFTVVGKYANTTSFIYAIEGDSRLGFKIENFSMKESKKGVEVYKLGEGQETSYFVESSFVCKEIKIDIKSLDGQDGKKDEINTTNTTNAENTTNTVGNTTNIQNAGNTTNTTNTTGAANTTATQNTVQ